MSIQMLTKQNDGNWSESSKNLSQNMPSQYPRESVNIYMINNSNYVGNDENEDINDMMPDMSMIYGSETLDKSKLNITALSNQMQSSGIKTTNYNNQNSPLSNNDSVDIVGSAATVATDIGTARITTSKEDLIFFDSIEIEFSIRIFFRQLVVHLFHPFFIYLTNPDAQAFITYSIPNIFLGIIQPFMVYAMIVSYSLSPDTVITGALYFPLLYYVLHKVVVAVKYACLSESEYKRFQSSKRPHSQRYRKQMELVSGWLRRDPLVLDFELSAAIARAGLQSTSKLRFKIGPPLKSLSNITPSMRKWLEYLYMDEDISDIISNVEKRSLPQESITSTTIQRERSITLIREEDGTYISMFDLCSTIVKRSDQKDYYFDIFDRGCILMSLLNVVLTFIPLMNHDGHNDDGSSLSIATIVFYISMIVISFSYFVIVFEFMYIGAFDIARQVQLLLSLYTMIRVDDTTKSININFKISKGKITEERTFIEREILDRAPVKRKNYTSSGTSSKNSKENMKLKQVYDIESILDDTRVTVDDIMPSFTASNPMMYNASMLYKPSLSNPSETENPSSSPLNSGFKSFSKSIINIIQPSTKIQSSNENQRPNVLSKASSKIDFIIPKLKLDNSENVLAWTYTRLVLYNFGKRFRFRLETYATIIVAIIILLILYIIVTIVSASNNQRRMVVFKSIFFRQALLAVTLIFIYLLILTYTGASMNDSVDDHISALSSHTLRNQLKIYDIRDRIRLLEYELVSIENNNNNNRLNEQETSTKINLINSSIRKLRIYMTQVEEAQEVLDRSIEAIKLSNSTDPYTVLGIPAQDALVTSIASAAFGFYVTLYQLYNPSVSNTPLGQFS